MTWPTIARKEFDDAVKSRLLWGIVAIIAVMTSLSAAISLLVPDVEGGPEMALGGASQFAGLPVPIVALIAAYLAVAGERESGSLKVLLGLPPSRAEVLVGKFLGRSGVVVIALVLGFAVSFVGIAVGISAATATRARAMTLAISAYLGLTLLWDLAPNGVHLLVAGEMPGAVVPAWFLLLQGLSPTGAYNALVQTLLLGSGVAVEARIGGPAPAFLHPGVFLALLAVWAVLPLVAGYVVFRRADLS